MRVTVNGEHMETSARTVGGLLDELKVRPEGVAVEVNLGIVKKTDYATYSINEDDQIEVVNLVGGG